MKKVRGVKKFLINSILGIAILLIVIALWHKIAVYNEDVRSKYPGEIIKVNGHNIHVYRQGEGNPTVLFTTGWGSISPYIDFYPIHKEISKKTRIIMYDRPGYGWSDTASTYRDIEQITNELHELLNKIGEKPPYVFVAHSYGALETIRYAQMYPEEVGGILTIDGGNPEFYSKKKEKGKNYNTLVKIGRGIGVFRVLDQFGYTVHKHFKKLPRELREITTELINARFFNESVIEEAQKIQSSANEVIKNGNIGEIPLTILTASESACNGKWKESQEKFRDWSKKRSQIVVEDSTHYIQWDKPKYVEEKIIELIEKE